MRRPPQILFGSLLAALLTGCAGYNTTMFMTKSNAGLDFDAKPPTAEINISRKEAVIAPGFEGGKTPPVMASFKPDTGFGGGFGNFFMGVDQTFAGGDAAEAMAKLYNSPNAPADTSLYDSTLELTETPKYKNVFQRLARPGEIRPFIFGTDTMLGLKVAWSGAGGQMPDTVKLGFNRKEFAWAPVTMTTKRTATKTNYHVKMPSFLATIDSKIEAGSKTNGISALQYFATGNAATLLALQPDVRAAMLARLDPNNDIFKAKFGAQAQSVLGDTLFAVQTILNRFAGQGDAAARALTTRLDHLEGLALPDKVGTQKNPTYSYNTNDPTKLTLEWNVAERTLPVPADLDVIKSYLFGLERSLGALQLVTRDLAANETVQLTKNGAAPTAITNASPEAVLIQKDLPLVEAKLLALRSALSSNRDVVAAYRYVESMISPQ